MNALRRKSLGRILDVLEVDVNALLEVIEEEEEAMDNIPESLQNTDKYMEAEDALAELIGAQESMADYIENLRELFHIEF